MSDDPSTQTEREPEEPGRTQPSEAAHDDIMKRLLDYQRRQQTGATKEEAASSVWAVVTPPVAREEHPATVEAVHPTPSPAETEPVPQPMESVRPEPPPEEPALESPHLGGADARIETLHGALDRLGSQVGEMRQVFQDMAIAADERLAEIESEIARVRSESERPA